MTQPQSPVAIVTGSARGIGAAIAEALARGGYDVALLDVADTAGSAEVVRGQGRRALSVACDIASAEQRGSALNAVVDAFGRVDTLVNNAGVAPRERRDLLEATEESYDRVMNINLKGPYFLTQLVARRMLQQRAEGDRAFLSIVNISSISAFTASVARGEYCLSKAGVSMATKLWAARLADEGVCVYEIQPGIIATDMTAAVKDKYDKLIDEGLTPIRRWGTPEDIGRAVAVAASGRLGFSTGEVIHVDGGFHLRTL